MAKAKSTQRVTIDDVARLAGFSIATVSRVINQNYPVSEETAKRVKAAIKELNYVPQQAARQLAKRRTGMLGLVLDEIGGDFFSPMLRGIEAGAREAGYNLLIATTQGTSSTGRLYQNAAHHPYRAGHRTGYGNSRPQRLPDQFHESRRVDH